MINQNVKSVLANLKNKNSYTNSYKKIMYMGAKMYKWKNVLFIV